MKTIFPCNDNVLVKRDEGLEKSKGGIIIPGSAKEKTSIGTVMQVGPGRIEQGFLFPMRVSVGSRVYFRQFAGHEVTHEDETLLFLSEKEILGIIK